MAKYYFFRTVRIEGKPRLRPLEGQTDETGRPVLTDMNVKADHIRRGSYPLGTVFGTNSLEMMTHSATPYYSAGSIFPMGLNLGAYIESSHIPPKEMTDAWNDYKNSPKIHVEDEGGLFTGTDSQEKETAAAPKPLSLREQIEANGKYSKPTVENEGFYIEDKNWTLLVRNILKKINTMLIGPSGTGKTELVMLACRKLGLECNIYDMGSMHDPISGLLGVHRLAAGGSTFDYAKFTEDIQKPGVILLDELSRAPENTNNILFPCLDKRRMLPVEIADSSLKRKIEVHPDCIFIATANIGSEYTGTREIDRALRDRFISQMELGYMPSDHEAEVLVKKYGISRSDAINIVAVAFTIRNLYDKGELSTTISTRSTLAAAEMVSDGWTALEAMELTYLPYFEGNTTDGERSIVSKIFMTR